VLPNADAGLAIDEGVVERVLYLLPATATMASTRATATTARGG
jgi:hypothetical protein